MRRLEEGRNQTAGVLDPMIPVSYAVVKCKMLVSSLVLLLCDEGFNLKETLHDVGKRLEMLYTWFCFGRRMLMPVAIVIKKEL